LLTGWLAGWLAGWLVVRVGRATQSVGWDAQVGWVSVLLRELNGVKSPTHKPMLIPFSGLD